MVSRHRKAIESLYKDRCDIQEAEKVKNPVTKQTKSEWVLRQEDIPFRLSYGKSPSVSDGMSAGVSQTITLFLSPDILVKEGSKITVRQKVGGKWRSTVYEKVGGKWRSTVYENSGTPQVYGDHQQIELKLRKDWA